MDNRYIYEAILKDDQVVKALDTIQGKFAELARRASQSFKEVQTSMDKMAGGKGIEQAARVAEQALTREEQAAKRLEATMISLLARQLNLAAGGDRVAKNLIAQARAGAETADSFVKVASLYEGLSQAQIDYAQNVARIEAQIRKLTGELDKEGANEEAILSRIARLKDELAKYNLAQQQAAADAQRLSEAKQQALAAIEAENERLREQEQLLIKLTAEELRRQTTRGQEGERTRQRITEHTQTAGSADQLAMEIQATGRLTEAQVQQAQARAALRQQIIETSQAIASETGSVDELIAKQASLESQLSALDAAQAGAQASTREQARAFDEAEKRAEAYQRTLLRLTEEELKRAAETPEVKQRIGDLAKTASSSDQLLEQVALTKQLTEAQIEEAGTRARLRAEIQANNQAMTEEGANKQELMARQAELIGSLNAMDAARKRGAEAAREELVLIRQETAAKKDQEQANRRMQAETVKLIRTFPEQTRAVARLVEQYGSFDVALNRTESELSDVERKFLDIIKSSDTLQAEFQRLQQTTQGVAIGINRTQFNPNTVLGMAPHDVRRLGFALERMGFQGAAAIGEMAAVSGLAVAGLAAVGLGVAALIKQFVELSQKAAEAFIELIKGSVEFAAGVDTARAQFNAFFQQDVVAAGAVLDRLLALSTEMGQDVIEIGRAFIPDVGSVDQLERLVRIAVALARYQPEQGITGARVALQDLLTGQTRSLVMRFEFNRQIAREIENIIETDGIEAGLIALEEELQRTGRSVEALADTWAVAWGRIEQFGQRMSEIIGAAPLEALKDRLQTIFELLEEKADELEPVAIVIGEIVARFIELTGTKIEEFLRALEAEDFEGVLTQLYTLGEALRLLTGLLFELVTSDSFKAVELGIAAWNALLYESLALLVGVAVRLNNLKYILPGNEFLPSGAERRWIDEDGAMEELRLTMSATNEEGREFVRTMFEIARSTEESGESALEAANNFLHLQAAMREIRDIEDELTELQEEINEKRLKFLEDLNRRRADIERDYGRDLIDLEIELSRKREDIARKMVEKLQDLETKRIQDIRDAGIKYDRDLEDAALAHQRRLEELEIKGQEKRIKLEEDYQRKLAALRRKYDFDAAEAIRQNDAVQLLRLRRQLAFNLQEARVDRDDKSQDIDKETQREREALQRRYDQQREDAATAHSRRMEDLQRQFQDRMDAIELDNRRELEQLDIWEERKREDINKKYERRIRDYIDYARQKKIELDRQMRDELAREADLQQQLATQWSNYFQTILSMYTQFFNDRDAILRENPELGAHWRFIDENNPPGSQPPPGGTTSDTPDDTGTSGGTDTTGDTSSTGTTGLTIGQLRFLARRAVVESTMPETTKMQLLGDISSMSGPELIRLINDLGGDFNLTRQHGGPVMPGFTYVTGERGVEGVVGDGGLRPLGLGGPELYRPRRPEHIINHATMKRLLNRMRVQRRAAGGIAMPGFDYLTGEDGLEGTIPADLTPRFLRTMYSPPAPQQAGSTTIDNSRRFEASLPYRHGLGPTEKREVVNLFWDMFEKARWA